jgi:hypothetical protein
MLSLLDIMWWHAGGPGVRSGARQFKKKQECVQKRIQNKFGSRQLFYCGSILCFLGSYLCFGFTRNSHGFSIAVETGRLVHNFLAQPYTRGASHSQLASHCQPLPAAASHSQTSDFIY